MNNNLTTVQSRTKFYKNNCDGCELFASCNMRQYIGENLELNADDVEDYFGSDVVDEDTICLRIVSSDGDSGVRDELTPSLF